MAIYSAKQIIEFYKKRKTTVYGCFLDLSKAFDRVCHKTLWEKLKARNIPTMYINTLSRWHSQQENVVRWASTYSQPIYLRSGVRQGGCMSPILFNVYMDELSNRLDTRAGCRINSLCLNHISYADDMILLAPSIKGLRILLKICEEYANTHNMMYNPKKTELIAFHHGKNPEKMLPVQLNEENISTSTSVKYLGHIITVDLSDDGDIERQRRSTSVLSNMIARRFFRCSNNVKKTLFNAFCTSLYTCETWCQYRVSSMERLRIQYNDACRIIFGYRRYSSASTMFTELGLHGFASLMRHRVTGARMRIMASDNTVVTAAFQHQAPLLSERWARAHSRPRRA